MSMEFLRSESATASVPLNGLLSNLRSTFSRACVNKRVDFKS